MSGWQGENRGSKTPEEKKTKRNVVPLAPPKKEKTNRYRPEQTKFCFPKKIDEKSEAAKSEAELEKCSFFDTNKATKIEAESKCEFPSTSRGKKAPSPILPFGGLERAIGKVLDRKITTVISRF